MQKPDVSLTYQMAGVNIDEGNELVQKIKSLAKKTHRPEILGGIGGFGALCELPKKYQEPILVSSTDGVGTKLKIAIEFNQHNTIGIDLVAMCVNDVITLGAEPLFFLDYFATGKLNAEQGQQIIAGIAEGCKLAGAALIGGETAEMPGMYSAKDYDLAGFCVGVVEKKRIIDGNASEKGDVLIALPSSGLHANGFSLVRKIVEKNNINLKDTFEANTFGETLLTPTRIYTKAILKLHEKININAIAHITGGGLLENIPRVLPPFTKAVLDSNSWQWPAIFKWLQNKGNIALVEMHRTFNVGVGMVISVNPKDLTHALDILKSANEKPWVIGYIEKSATENPTVIIN